ncbi:EscR/YscR/HrcR family type III secretion system export apparatus protein [bacterium]|nr:EscR/YscR/HrcR family type III secretion system export apparatus protein [bacterium]NCQ62103.1 EscR/YscR/HrcR family type III secretion system export apparatus protein [Myxococcales bacterium]
MIRGKRLGTTLVALSATAIVLSWSSEAGAQEGSFAGNPLVSMVVLGALSLLPFLFMTTTSFVKISVVFSILRNALGTGQVPSGLVIASLSVLLTLYVMAPVGEEISEAAAPAVARVDLNHPLEGESFDAVVQTFRLGLEPMRGFLRRNAGARETRLFWNLARHVRAPERRGEVGRDDMLVLLPSFLITELTEAFQIGFLVFIPFLVVDMVVANVLLALGMHMLSPTTVSLPFKLLLFVLVDGWYLLARALVLGYS